MQTRPRAAKAVDVADWSVTGAWAGCCPAVGGSAPRLPACAWGPEGVASPLGGQSWGLLTCVFLQPAEQQGPDVAWSTSRRACLLAVTAPVAAMSATHPSLGWPRRDTDVGTEGGSLAFLFPQLSSLSPWEDITRGRGLCPQLVGTGGLS